MKRAADLCTLLRVLLAPLFAWMFLGDVPSAGPALVFAVAAATDFADGRLARAAGGGTRLGRIFDHGADALFLFPALGVLAWSGRVPALLPIAACSAFALYVLDGRRRAGSVRSLELTGSRFGALAGVGNYVVAGGAALARIGLESTFDALVWSAAALVAALNALACIERVAAIRAPLLSSSARR